MATKKLKIIDPIEPLRKKPLGIKKLILNPASGWSSGETFEPFDELPSEIFACTNLEHLEIWNALSEDSDGKLPAAVGNLRKLQVLKLHGVTELPEEIGQCVALEELSVHHAHQLAKIPESIGKLKNLRTLNLGGGGAGARLTKLPDAFAGLTKLEKLILPSGKVKDVPPSTWKLTTLRSLHLPEGTSKLSAPSIGKLTKLEILSLSAAALSSVAKELPKLQALKSLTVKGVSTSKSLPTEVGALASLEMLFAVNVGLESLPDSIAGLKSLETLAVGGNRLTELSGLIRQLPKLKSFTCHSNKFAPAEEKLLEKMRAASPSERASDAGTVEARRTLQKEREVNLEKKAVQLSTLTLRVDGC